MLKINKLRATNNNAIFCCALREWNWKCFDSLWLEVNRSFLWHQIKIKGNETTMIKWQRKGTKIYSLWSQVYSVCLCICLLCGSCQSHSNWNSRNLCHLSIFFSAFSHSLSVSLFLFCHILTESIKMNNIFSSVDGIIYLWMAMTMIAAVRWSHHQQVQSLDLMKK